ncbi:MAG: phosphatidate cytidylyltransferase [Bacilli bacterium]|nr:phosphatidate cytidylyltransferase [Bacilli bacterium]
MKIRIISAIVALLIFVPIIFYGGVLFNVAAYLIGLIGLKEFMDAGKDKKEIPFVVKFIAYVLISLIILTDVTRISINYSLDYRIIALLFLSLLTPVILYHDDNKYSIKDAFYLISGVLFLGISVALLIMLRHIDLKLFIFLFIITITTDTFAYVTGCLIGKHKMVPKVSPKKTWEGMVGGTVMGVFISSMFYYTCINPSVSLLNLILVCTFLSLVGQVGDLVFSSIKRYFKIKDFSNIMPGHGGILDRLDSIIFVILGFTFFISIL